MRKDNSQIKGDVPHEVMHAIGLQYTFPESPTKNINKEHTFRLGSTDNYMDYQNTKKTTFVWQWEQLMSAFVLIDVRHEPQKIDMEFMQWLGEHQIPFSIIFTKADKLKPKAIERNVQTYLDILTSDVWEEASNHFITSSSSGVGKDELLNYIDQINKEYQQNVKDP